MVQVTSLSVLGIPGRIHAFSPKAPAVVIEFPCLLTTTVETVFGMAATLDVTKDVASTVDTVKAVSTQIKCEH